MTRGLFRIAAMALAISSSASVAQRKEGHTATENGVGGVAPCGYAALDNALIVCSPKTPLPIAAAVVDGSLQTVTASSTAGVLLPGRPDGARTLGLYLGTADSVTYTIATAQPASAPAATITISGASYAAWTETLGPSTNVYVTAVAGTPRYRWQ